MFGIDKIWKEIKILKLGNKGLNALYELNKDHIKSVQSTNDKRYNEICNEIRLIKTVQEKHHTDIGVLQKDVQQKPYSNDLVKCDECRCLLEKQDAIKGESRIKKKYPETFLFGVFNESLGKEEIEEVYKCHKCGGKDEKTKKAINPKRRSTKISK